MFGMEKKLGAELVGAWKMVSCSAEVEGEPEPRYPVGRNPQGFVVITANHRIIALVTSGDKRKPATNDAEAAALLRSLIGYSGRFELDAEKFVTTPDVTATGSYIGEKQVRYYKVDGDNLTIRSGVQQGSLYPGKKTVSTNIFVREK
jgi:hypothetical protein